MRRLAALLALTATACSDAGGDKDTDPDGPSDPGSAPECTITAPEDGIAVAEGAELRFDGTATDADETPDRLSVVWTSDIDGELQTATPDSDGTVVLVTSSLTLATHQISLLVTDEVGETCTDSIYVAVGSLPTLTIDTPVDSDRVSEGDLVAFTGSVSDVEDRAEDLSMAWVSSLDGLFSEDGADSTGALSLSVDTLQAGVHELEITVTDSDGLYAIDRRTLLVNALPTVPTVTIDPDPAFTIDTLTATATGSTDPDESGAVTYAYAWTEDGAPLSETGATLPATETAKNRTYRVTVTPSDDLGPGESASAEVTVSNSVPVLSGPTLSTSTVVVGDTLTCAATATDADDDSVSITYAWSDGSTDATYTVTETDDPGDTITCTATADDGDGGVSTATASATVDNTAPTVDSVSVSPTTGKVGDTLTCSATASDVDGGTPTITYAWSTGETGDTYVIVESDDPGNVITCTATATDTDGGAASDTASATVENTDPSVDTVSISPTTAHNDDTLTCSATASDADGGTPTLAYAWTGSTSGSLGSTDTVDLSTTAAASGETITCTVTASDTDSGSDVGSATLDLDNRAPTISVSLSPSSGATRIDTLTCTATVEDDDDDSLSTTFAWTVEGSGVAASSTSGLTSTLAGAFVAGEEAICTATTDDGKGGTDGASASTTITNIAPTVSAVTLDKSVVYTNDTLTASVASSDMDGDSLTITYDWYVEGSSVQDGASDTLSGASSSVGFDKDEEVYVVVSVTDGTDMTTSTSSTLTVSNTPPEAPVLTIDPSDPFTGEDLFCEVTSESFDADGDTVTYSMAWNDDSGAYSGAITDVWTDDTVDGVDTAGGEVWECTATPNDGDEDGSTASESVSVWGLCDDGTVALTASSVDFVSVCTGIFDVGCTPGQSSCTSDESPVMPVTLDREFYISQTEVTQEQYEDLMGSNPATFSSCGSDCPVETTSWHMAAAFANAMSVANDLNECYECTGSGSSTSCSHAMDPYTCDGYRLPTEAEWEVAARCGEDYLYAGSNTASAVSVYGVSSTVAVGTKSANDCGLYDMSGNVYEWVDDWYSGSYYLAAGRTAPTGPSSGSGRVIRGGSALNTVASMRTSDRFFTSPGTRASYLGFRLARTVDGDYDGDGYLLSEDCDDTDRSAWEDPDCDPDIIAVFPKVSSWPNAQADCLSRGAHLVWIESADVNSQVLDLCNSSPDVGEQTCSIGLQSPYTAWENGDAVTYTNWDTGTFDGSGIYAMMYNSQYLGASSAIGEWDDAYPTNKPYICRFANGIGDYTGADNTAEVR